MFRFVFFSVGAHALLAGTVLALGWHGSDGDVPDFDPAGVLLGETMTVDLDEGLEARAGAEGAPGAETVAVAVAVARNVQKSPGASSEVKPARRASAAAVGGEAGGGAEKDVGLFGAVGERSAADLATAFVRGFPQVASVDVAWGQVKLGSMGNASIELELSEEGRILSHRVQSAPPPLDQALERTVSLLKGRKFTARGARTKLVLKCVVSADVVHDGLHGEVFALGNSFTGRTGNAFFALASGRRVDVDVSIGR